MQAKIRLFTDSKKPNHAFDFYFPDIANNRQKILNSIIKPYHKIQNIMVEDLCLKKVK
jgi:hypothetical protein